MKQLEYVIQNTISYEIEEKRSRFIATAFFIGEQTEAKEIIQSVREEHPGASHTVYAYKWGRGNTKLLGMSDDGEPRGTAGRPVLEVLKGSPITNILITVTRYFGGTKLGTGGLVRAYTRAAQEVLSHTTQVPYVSRETFSVVIPYNLHREFRDLFSRYGVGDLREEFSEEVTLQGSVISESLRPLMRDITELSKGTIQVTVIEE